MGMMLILVTISAHIENSSSAVYIRVVYACMVTILLYSSLVMFALVHSCVSFR